MDIKPTTPLAHYRQQIAAGVLKENPAQLKVVRYLDNIFHELITRQTLRDSLAGKIRRKIKPRPPIQGLYLWGGVGVGKTHLIDSFYNCLPTSKLRMHFHEFMRMVQQQLNERQGIKNPLKIIAKEIADKYIVICFDEFFVSNIADAMLLGELFQELFKGGVCLIATSNIQPDFLYHDGIQRERFLPAIDSIKQHTQIVNLITGQDFRLRHIQQAGVYYTPLDAAAADNMEQSFKHFSQGAPYSTENIELFGRQINVIKKTNTIIWFDFIKICGRPRSQADYLAIAEHYNTLLISNIPIFKEQDSALALSFINLIDVLYDHKVRLVLSAAAPVNLLYQKGRFLFEFKRTKSRLIEMQSQNYYENSVK